MRPSPGVRVFLSYARRDASPLAESVAAFLQDEGYEVWRDRPEIRPGQAFMSEIEAAIAKSHVVVALLSPNSVRRQGEIDHLDSVCLDELAFARFSEPAVPIVPVMAIECRPPLEIYRLDYVDLTRESDRPAGLRRLCDGIAAALRGETRYRSWVDNLRPWDFRNIVGVKRRDFIGRDWLIDEVLDWLSNDVAEPALIIKGDPGSGKSAVMAELVHRNPAGLLGYHFCQAETPETLKPGRFVRSVAAMLASQLPEYEERLAAGLPRALGEAVCDDDPFSSFEEGVLAPLDALASPPAKAFLLIDALDESLARRDVHRGTTIVELLADRVYRMPKWLRIVATTRKEEIVLRRLRGLPHREIDVHSNRNQDDIEAYVRQWAAKTAASHSALPGSALERLVTGLRQSGNFLVVVETLKSIEKRHSSLEEVEQLPAGLYPLYERFFARSFPVGESAEAMTPAVRKVLQVVLAAQKHLTEPQLAQVTGLSSEHDLPAALKALAPFVPGRMNEEGAIEYSIYHKSFADWLTDSQLRGTAYYIGRLEGHRQLAARFYAEYAGGVENLTDYSLAYGVSHSRNGGDSAPVFEALTDAAYLCRKVRMLGLQPLLDDFHDLAKLPGLSPAQQRGLQALRQALRLLTPIVADGLVEFEVQLEARIRGVETLGKLRQALQANFQPGCLRPVTAPLPAWDGPLQVALKGADSVAAVGIFHLGPWGVTGDEEGRIRVWDLDAGLPLVGTSIEPDGCASCSVHPSEPLAIFGTYRSSSVAVVNLESGKLERRQLPGFKGGGVVRFSHDGERFLSCHEPWSDEGPTAVACWQLKGTKPLWIHKLGKGESVGSVEWLPGDQGILVLTATRLLSFSALGHRKGTLLEVPEANRGNDESPPEGLENLAIDQCGRRLAIARNNGRIDLYAAAAMKPIGSLRGHPMGFYTTSVPAMTFVGEKTLITGGWDGAIRLWDLDRNVELRSYHSSSKIFDMAVFDGGRRALSGQKIFASRVWDLDAPVASDDEPDFLGSLRVDSERRRAIGTYGRHGVRLVDLETRQCRDWTFREETYCVAFRSQTDQAVVLAGKEVRQLDLKARGRQGHRVARLKLGRYESIDDGCVSGDGSVVLFGLGSRAFVWRPDLGMEELQLAKDNYIYAQAVCVNRAALGIGDGPIRVFDITQRRPRPRLIRIAGQSSIHSMALSRSGTLLAAGYEEGRIRVVDLRPAGRYLQVIADIEAHRDWVSHLWITEAGRVSSVGLDGVLCVSDAKGGRVLGRLTSEEGWGACVLEEDGRTVWVAGGRGGAVHRLQYAGEGVVAEVKNKERNR